MTNRMREQFSAACAALTAFVFLGCMGGWSEESSGSSSGTSTCTGIGSAYRPRPSQYADLVATSADFGDVSVGDTVTGEVTLSNSGNSATSSFTVDALPPPFAYAGGSHPGTGGTCGTTIAAGSVCKLVVAFSPTATSTNAAHVAIRYQPPPYSDITQGVTYLHLSGRARPDRYADLRAPEQLQFGAVRTGTDARATITVSNKGNAATADIAADALQPPFAYAGGSFPGAEGTCGRSLDAGDSCTLVVTYAPATGGPVFDQLRLRYTPGPYTDAPEGTTFVGLYGIGMNVALSPDSHDFGSIPVSSTASAEFTLTNPTPASIAVKCWGFLTGYGYHQRGGTCCDPASTAGSVQLAPGKACTVGVEFIPPSVGQFNATLSFSQCDALPCAWSNSVALTGVAR